jgi:hypothetical protein
MHHRDDRNEIGLEDVCDGVREPTEHVPMGAVLGRPSAGILDDQSHGALDELIEAASHIAVTIGVVAASRKSVSASSRKR